jgi:hypothetical protein
LKFEDVGKEVIDQARGINGNIAYFFPSTQRQAKQGDSVHYLWPDEDVAYPEHLAEWRNRLKSAKGRFAWSATPQMKHEELLKLCRLAEEDER